MKKHTILTLILIAFAFMANCKEEAEEEKINHIDVKNEQIMRQLMNLSSDISVIPLGDNSHFMRHTLHSFEGQQSVSFPPPYGHPCGENYYSGSWEYRDGTIHVKIDRAKSEEDCSLEHIEYKISEFSCNVDVTGCLGYINIPEIGGRTKLEIQIWDYAPRSK